MQTEKQGFDEWALVEIMGHQRIAGRVTEQEIGGQKFVRVDVPEVEGKHATIPAMTKFLGAASIYAITPMTEETARHLAIRINPAPIDVYDARELVRRADAVQAKQLRSSVSEAFGDSDDEEEDDEMDAGNGGA
jgi:hypothetical protein